MLGKKLVQCRSCRLKWIPTGEPAGTCPACGGKELAGALELFHVGLALVVVAGIAWVVPAKGPSPASGPAVATAAAMPPVVETKQAPPNQRPHEAQQRSHVAAAPHYALIRAKKLTAHVQRGPARGHTVTLRRGDKVRILDRNDRRYLVSDRRGNQIYVTLDKLNLQPSADKGRRYVQR